MVNIAIFASGNGSNAENIINYFNGATDRGAHVNLVICNRKGAGVIDRAARLGVDCRVMTRAELSSPEILLPLLKEYSADLIVLAGYLLMIPEFLLRQYEGRIINIHPSLLPKYGGKGMYGHHVHEAVVAAGERETGISIHYVTEECDGGEIIFQAKTALAPTDTVEDVEAKIHVLEQENFPRVIETVVRNL